MADQSNMGPLFEALAKAQGELQNPPRNREVEVVSKRTGGRYKFRYATFDVILDIIRPVLSKHGLSITQGPTRDEKSGGWNIRTILGHSSGEHIANDVPMILPQDADMQAFGSSMTYARRYGISAILGIAPEEDDDGNHASGNTVTAKSDREVAQRPRPAPREEAPSAPAPDADPHAAEDEEAKLREAYTAIMKALRAAKVERSVDDILALQKEKIEKIREHNSKAGEKIDSEAEAARVRIKEATGA